ncbi:hypothetical protein F5B22DRAFT_51505 [Xylaria bambusicola]|uniref:uncharacterized protein n=1 Tax=Xylaria bambusicola TaxID=326684 RepID=UPI002008129C|nr:uncharacterized protein F5B22DRAFT_51505 [Xylaria bambusicola]KAI0520781.1 hypothetical protein F5B22DRAFT_51505 [Xylaria bambusicola]
MHQNRILIAALAAGVPSLVNGQESGWVEGQKSATMCAWKGLRAAQINDTVYIDGGNLYWVPELANGDFGPALPDGNPLGLIYTLNFSIPFNTSTNISSILGNISKAPGGGAANNFGPNYYDGAMLANNLEFFLYGGLLRQTSAYELPEADDTLAYIVHDGLDREGWHPGFLNKKLPENMTRYVTYGGAANAPSENKAWYFGGSRAQSWGPIYQPGYNDTTNPLNASNTLITLDFNVQQSEIWTNTTLPPGTESRANPSVVWVPVGEQGILVVLGGVLYPSYSTGNPKSLNEAQSEKDSPRYMTNIDIYDVAGKKWYQQPTTGAPPALAMGCAVTATAQDQSSYNIYYYGGYDGIHEKENFNDDVWILSLPSFIWTKIPGTAGHARAGHQCLTPYPDQMVSIGGSRSLQGASIKCLDSSIVEVFNLTEGRWLSSYDPSRWSPYGVPEVVHSKIGGDYTGGATIKTPTPSGWAASGLADIFATTYPASKLTTYYPYSSQSSGNETRGPWNEPKKGGGTPSWVAPVLGVVLGLVFITAIVVGILLYRRRSLLSKRNNRSETPAGDDYGHRHYIRVWLNNTQEKAQTVTTEDPSTRFDFTDSRNETPMRSVGFTSPSPIPEMTQHVEMPGDHQQLPYELGDTSSPRVAELSGGSPRSALKASSFFTGSTPQEQPSSLSSSQAALPPPSVAETLGRERPDSPPLGNMRRTPPPNRHAVVSDLSGINEQAISHLRNLSGGTVSSTAPSMASTPPAVQTGFNGPVSPPLPSPPSALDDHDAGDYITAHHHARYPPGPGRMPGTNSASRLSMFHEDAEDLGDSSTRAGHNTR